MQTVNISGNWSGEIKTPVSYSPLTISFRFEHTAKELTGFAWPGVAQVPIKNVKREGNRLSLEISGENMIYRFNLSVGAGLLEGDVSADDHGHTWIGKARLIPERAKEGGEDRSR